MIPQFGRFEDRAMILHDLTLELREWNAGVSTTSKPVFCYDHAVDLEMLRFLLGLQLPSGWVFKNIRGLVDPARRAAYFLKYGGEHHALYDARANACACSS